MFWEITSPSWSILMFSFPDPEALDSDLTVYPHPLVHGDRFRMGLRLEISETHSLDFGLLNFESMSQEMSTTISPVYSEGLYENEANTEKNNKEIETDD